MTTDPVSIAVGIGTGLGMIAAGLGIYRFGSARGELQAKSIEAMDLFISTQVRIVQAAERTANIAERADARSSREQALISTSLRALWDEWEERKKAEEVVHQRELLRQQELYGNARETPHA